MLLTLTHPRLTTTTLAVVPVVVGAAFFFGRAAAAREHRRAGPRGRSDGHGRRGVLADPHGAELHARGARRRGATATLLARRGDGGGARARSCARRSSASSASSRSPASSRCCGRAAGWCSTATLTPGALVSFLLLRDHGGRRGRLARVAVRQLPGGDRRGAARVRAARHASRRSPSPRGRCRSPRPVRGAVALERRALPLRAELPDVLSDVSLAHRARARWWRSWGRRARARRRSRRCSRASGT